MLKKIELVSLKSIKNGGALKPAILEDRDGVLYYVKIKDHPLIAGGYKTDASPIASSNASKRKTLINEFVCAGISSKLGLNCAEGYACTIQKKLGSELVIAYNKIEPDYQFTEISEGPHFASKEIIDGKTWSDLTHERKVSFLNDPTKAASITELIVFQHAYVINVDPGDGNFLLDNSNTLWAIDHGNTFDGEGSWPNDLMNGNLCSSLPKMDHRFECAKKLWELGKKENRLSQAAIKIKESIDNIFLQRLLESVPPNWNLTSVECEALLEFLRCRRDKLPELIQRWCY